jgi:hypothetical protein
MLCNFPFKENLWFQFYNLIFFGGFSIASLNLIFSISGLFNFDSKIFFQIQKLLGPILRMNLVPYTQCRHPPNVKENM